MATYGSEVGVENINAHFTGGYTTSTNPTSAAISSWLAEGYAAINMAIAKAGYTQPVASTAACYAVLSGLNNLYAAAMAEQAVNVGPLPETETRAAGLWKLYREGLADFLSGDLTQLGLSLASTAPPRRHVRSLQMRHYDGYAVNADDADTGEYS